MFQNPTDLSSVKKYPFYSDLLSKIYNIRDNFSVMPQISGKSVLGRGIFSIPIGNPESSVLLMGGIKGSHWITSVLLLLFCEDLLRAYQTSGKLMGINIGKVLENRGVIILPCLNPDGFEISLGEMCENESPPPQGHKINSSSLWDFNANGVDIPLNFDTNWDSKSINDNEFLLRRGKTPFSEPESTCIAKLCFQNNMKHLVTLGLGDDKVYYDYKNYAPSASKLMAELIVSGSTYSACRNCDNYFVNNWFIKTFRKPAFSICMNANSLELSNSAIMEIYSKVKESLIISLIL